MDFLEKLRKQIAEFFSSVDSGTKLMAVLFTLVIILAFSVAVFMNRKPSFSLLYSNLSESSAAEMVRIMDDNNIDFELKNQGRNIYVRKDNVNKVRLLLKSKGLPKDGESIGYEIFDKANLGVTEFVQNIQHNRALAGELERTISQIKGVEGVRIHIVLPEEKLFEKDKNETSATVFLNLSFDGALNSSQINSIRQLVSSSVEGLKPKNVTVVDNFGNVLAAEMDDQETFGVANTRMTIQKGVEDYYTKKVQTLLDSVLGAHKSVVRVDALLDFNSVEETEEKFDPESAVVRSEVITSEKTSGESFAAKGPPGIQSNSEPGKKGGETGSSEQNLSNREVINNKYEIDKKIRHFVKSVGDVNKLSVSVFLQQVPKLDKDGKEIISENGKNEYEIRSEEQLNMFLEIVKNAIGYNAERGDSVIIKEAPFGQKTPNFLDGVKMTKASDINAVIAPVVKFVTLIFLIFFLGTLLKKRGAFDSEYGSGKSLAAKNQGVISNALQQGAESGEVFSDIQKQGIAAVEKNSFVESEIGKLVDSFPKETEQVLRKWLKEE